MCNFYINKTIVIIFLASLDPLRDTVLSKVYVVEGKTQHIDDITEDIWQNRGMEQTDYQSIRKENDNIKKAKLFYGFILKSDKKGFEFLLRAIQKSKKNYQGHTECGKLRGFC